jgi:hypothetical protein
MLTGFDFFPQTFCLPSEYYLFLDELKRDRAVWIIKPTNRSQGKGIFLINRPAQAQGLDSRD